MLIKGFWLCALSASLMHGAEEEKKLTLRDCFEVKLIEVAGKPIGFYAPVCGERINTTFVWKSLLSGLAFEQPTSMRGCAGFVMGPNKELVDLIAQKVETCIALYENDSVVLRDEGMLSEDYLSIALMSDEVRNHQSVGANALGACLLHLIRFRNSADDRALRYVAPEELSFADRDRNNALLPWFVAGTCAEAIKKEADELCFVRRSGLIPLPDRADSIEELCGVRSVVETAQQYYRKIRARAQVVCIDEEVSHIEPVMVLNHVKWSAYMTQLYGGPEEC